MEQPLKDILDRYVKALQGTLVPIDSFKIDLQKSVVMFEGLFSKLSVDTVTKIQDRSSIWKHEADLPSIHMDFTDPEKISIVGGGMTIQVEFSRIDPNNIGKSFGMAFFTCLCETFSRDIHGSLDDAKLLTEKVVAKMVRLPHVQLWLVHAS